MTNFSDIKDKVYDLPFINKKAIGSISGIVGAGGNVGAFLAAILLKSKSAIAEKIAIEDHQGMGEAVIKAAQSEAAASAVSSGYLMIGMLVVATGICALAIRFSAQDEKIAQKELHQTSREFATVN